MHVPKKTQSLVAHVFVVEWSHFKHRRSQAERENAGIPATNLSVGFSDFGVGTMLSHAWGQV